MQLLRFSSGNTDTGYSLYIWGDLSMYFRLYYPIGKEFISAESFSKANPKPCHFFPSLSVHLRYMKLLKKKEWFFFYIFTSVLISNKQQVSSRAGIIPLEVSCVSSTPFTAVWPCCFRAHKSRICYRTSGSMRNNPSVLQMLQTLQFSTKLRVSQ